MLKEKALGDAAAGTVAIFYAIFYALLLLSPGVFTFLFNAQFFGADIASLINGLTFGTFFAALITSMATAWLAGYLFASFYNHFK